MKCPYFRQVYDAGRCLGGKLFHVPSIHEMGHFCFQENYNLCAILNSPKSHGTRRENPYAGASALHPSYRPKKKHKEGNND